MGGQSVEGEEYALDECGIKKDVDGRFAFKTMGWLHNFVDIFYFVGAAILFLVYGKWANDNAMPFSLGKIVFLTLVAFLCLKIGKVVLRNFGYYSVFAPGSGEVFYELRFNNQILRKRKLADLSSVEAVGVITRLPVFSMFMLLGKGAMANEALHEVALVLLCSNGQIIEVSHFSNDVALRIQATRRARFIARQLNIACRLCKDGEEFRVRYKAKNQPEFVAVNFEKAAAQSPMGDFLEMIKWPAILAFLIGGWYIFMTLSGAF